MSTNGSRNWRQSPFVTWVSSQKPSSIIACPIFVPGLARFWNSRASLTLRSSTIPISMRTWPSIRWAGDMGVGGASRGPSGGSGAIGRTRPGVANV